MDKILYKTDFVRLKDMVQYLKTKNRNNEFK
jgi:hypothetical protein